MRHACCRPHEVGLKVASPPPLATSDSAAGWRPDIVRFLFRFRRLFYFLRLFAAPSIASSYFLIQKNCPSFFGNNAKQTYLKEIWKAEILQLA